MMDEPTLYPGRGKRDPPNHDRRALHPFGCRHLRPFQRLVGADSLRATIARDICSARTAASDIGWNC